MHKHSLRINREFTDRPEGRARRNDKHQGRAAKRAFAFMATV